MTDYKKKRVATGSTELHGPIKLYIASEDPSFEDINQTLLSLNESILEGFSDVFRPETLTTGTHYIFSEGSLNDFMSGRERIGRYSVDVGPDVNTITAKLKEYLNSDAQSTESPVCILGIGYEDATWSVYLPAGEIKVKPESSEHYRLQKKGDIKSVRAPREPLEMQIQASTNAYAPDGYNKPIIYQLTIYVGADIYIEDSLIGEINRARLYEAIEYIAERFDVVEKSFSYGFTREPWMREHLFEYDGPSSNELIREYRLDWVQSELVETATQYEEDGETIFEVTSDAAAVQTDELCERIEAYVDHQREQGKAPQADRLRLVRTDGTPLEARFSDGNVEWVDDAVQSE